MSNQIQNLRRRRLRHRRTGKILTVEKIVVCLLVCAFILFVVWEIRPTRLRSACSEHLQRIGLALHHYHERYQSFPPAYVVGADGRPMHSWRALLLPFLDEPELAKSYRWDEAWDGPNNRKLWDQIPSVYRCPASGQPRHCTSYVAVVGPTTIWPNEFAVSREKVVDGLSNCIQVVEHDKSVICWPEPRDLPVPGTHAAKSLRPTDFLSSQHEGGAHVLMADGRVRLLSHTLIPEVFARVITIRSGLSWPGTGVELGAIPNRKFPPVADASELKRTDVWPHTHQHLEPRRNYIYCATMQLAWQKLAESLGVESIELPSKTALADELNQYRFDPKWLATESYSVNFGKKADLLELAKQRALPSKLLQKVAGNRGVHCVLQKSLPFEIAFDRLKPMPFYSDGSEQPVECFGIEDFSADNGAANIKGSQIRLIDIVSDSDFIIELISLSLKDRLILALIPPAETLAATVEAVEKRLVVPNSPPPSPDFHPGMALKVPNIGLNITKEYDELFGRVTNGTSPYDIEIVIQETRFQLDENGAQLESEAVFLDDGGSYATKSFIFDRPFLLLLQQRDANAPYFVLWIANTELLSPTDATKN